MLIQTYDPTHHALVALRSHDHEGFITREAETRSLFGYPPYAAAVVVRTEGRDGKAVSEMLEAFARFVDKSFADSTGRLRGPAPAIVERIRGKSRWALLITHTNRARLHEVIRLARTSIECPSTIRLIIDIDPIDLM